MDTYKISIFFGAVLLLVGSFTRAEIPEKSEIDTNQLVAIRALQQEKLASEEIKIWQRACKNQKDLGFPPTFCYAAPEANHYELDRRCIATAKKLSSEKLIYRFLQAPKVADLCRRHLEARRKILVYKKLLP